MERRDFLKIGSGATVLAAGSSAVPSLAADGGSAGKIFPKTPAILSSYTAEDHRQRLENIARGNQNIRACLRKHMVHSYMPGQACYNLGEYPCRKPWDPDEYDEQELDKLRDHDIELIQVFDDWNDSLRLFGGDKYTALNPEGFRRFVEMVHQRGMKIITYASTGFIELADPDFRPEWSRKGDSLHFGYWNMARCAPASVSWRAYLLPRIVRTLDDYGADGLYIDCGYVTNAHRPPNTPTKDEIFAFEESPSHDGALADLLAIIYAETKRRGGIVKLHIDAARQPLTGKAEVYDYLWVGEGVNNADVLREKVKNFPPYVVPCIDREFVTLANENEPYLHAIPYMQFPVLQAGRPFTGERATIPGIKYPPEEKDFWVRRCREIWKYYQANPNAPPTYSIWDSVPGKAEIRPIHARWLKAYRPLVEEGTFAWLEIKDSNLLTQSPDENVVASAFANRHFYLVLANYGHNSAQVHTSETYVSVSDSLETPSKDWNLKSRSLHILRRSVEPPSA
ncbi:MAG: hypothetical protein GXP24_04985 [Planctomycetes bacterium]|nr:hypothetical protein [Planctomycetota bacterium]